MFTRISTEDAKKIIDEEQSCVVDIRDPQSFAAGHIPGATALNNDNLQEFVANTDKTTHVLVCCYHGNSSQGAADFLNNQHGFEHVYSIDGGFESWKIDFEVES